MVWWVVAGMLLAGVALPVGAAMSLRGHLRPLRRAQRRLQLRAQQAERLQAKIATMQDRVLGLQAGLAEVAARTQAGSHTAGTHTAATHAVTTANDGGREVSDGGAHT